MSWLNYSDVAIAIFSVTIGAFIGAHINLKFARVLERDRRAYEESQSMNELKITLLKLEDNFRLIEYDGVAVFNTQLLESERKEAAKKLSLQAEEILKLLDNLYVHPGLHKDFRDFTNSLKTLSHYYRSNFYNNLNWNSTTDWIIYKGLKKNLYSRLEI